MADASVKWVVVENNWPAVRRGLETKADAIVARTALGIEAGAKVRAAVRTGFMRGSIQAVQVGPRHWRVTVGAEYGIYQEYGTVFSAPRPFFEPAIDEAWPAFQEAMRRVL